MVNVEERLQQFFSHFHNVCIGRTIIKISFPFPFATIFTLSSQDQEISILLSTSRHFPSLTFISSQVKESLQIYEKEITTHQNSSLTPFQKKVLDLVENSVHFKSLSLRYPYLEFTFSNGTSLFIAFDKHPRSYLIDKDGSSISCGSTYPLAADCKPKAPYLPFLTEETLLQAKRASYYTKHYKRVSASLSSQIRKAVQKKKELEERRANLPIDIQLSRDTIVLLNMLWGKTSPDQESYSISREESGLEDATLFIPHDSSLQKEIEKAAMTLKNLERKKEGISQEIDHVELQIQKLLSQQTALAAFTKEDIERGAFVSLFPDLSKRNQQAKKVSHKTKCASQENKNIAKFLSEDGDIILLGKDAEANERLTLQIARKNDYWFHVDLSSASSGPHVILKSAHPQKDPSQKSIFLAASIAAWFQLSSEKRHKLHANDSPLADVIYTQRKHITKRKGMKKGEVHVRMQKKLSIRPSKKEIDAARLRAERNES